MSVYLKKQLLSENTNFVVWTTVCFIATYSIPSQMFGMVTDAPICSTIGPYTKHGIVVLGKHGNVLYQLTVEDGIDIDFEAALKITTRIANSGKHFIAN